MLKYASPGRPFMRSVAVVILLLLSTTANSTAAFARCTQTTEVPAATASRSERDALCARAVREVEASRKYIADLEARAKLYEEQLTAERARAAASDNVDAAQRERIKLLEQQVQLITEALGKQREIAKELERRLVFVIGERDKARAARKIWLYFGVALGAAAVIVVDSLTGED